MFLTDGAMCRMQGYSAASLCHWLLGGGGGGAWKKKGHDCGWTVVETFKCHEVMSLRTKQIMSVNDDKASCYQDVVLWANCETRSYLDWFGRTHRSPFFVRQTQKPVNCIPGLIILFQCRANCMQLKPLWLTFNSLACTQHLLSCTYSAAAGWLAGCWGMSEGEICLLPCLVFSGQEKPLTAVLQCLNLPGIQPRDQVQQTKAFKHKASLQRSQKSRLWVKGRRGIHSEVTLN